MNPMLNVAIQAIRKAGIFIIKQYELFNKIHEQSVDHVKIFLSYTHKESNNIIKTIIKKFYPAHIIINLNNHYNIIPVSMFNNVCWIIESIDNNINFAKQFPFFVLSIAIQHYQRIEVGVIYDPIHNELFSACRGKGAQLNGYRIRFNQKKYIIQKTLNKIIFSIVNSNLEDHKITINIFQKLEQQYNTIINFRYTGSTILDLVYIAIGRIDGFLSISFKNPIKLASSFLIITESGGFITDFHGNSINNNQSSKNIIAGDSKIIKIILSIIKQHS